MTTKTKVFISWSGDLSKALAEAMREWLPNVLQFVEPYFTPEDIEKGKGWSSDIVEELEASRIGILCLTRENMSNPWILFEAGALFKGLTAARVCPVLFNLAPADVTGPLTMFQHTNFLDKDFKRLVNTINNYGGEGRLDSTGLDKSFSKWWPDLKEAVDDILSQDQGKIPMLERDQREILEEILELARQNARREGPSPEVDFDLARNGIHGIRLCLRRIKNDGPPLSEEARRYVQTMRHFLEQIEESSCLFNEFAPSDSSGQSSAMANLVRVMSSSYPRQSTSSSISSVESEETEDS